MADNLNAARKISLIAQALRDTARVGAESYANGAPGDASARSIVAAHFTVGNYKRFAPLSSEYLKQKTGQNKQLKANMRAAHRSVPTGKLLPILVRTGLLRDSITKRKHQITASGDNALITFADLPEYAEYLDDGTPKMPKRSPVDPNHDDQLAIQKAMERFMSLAINRGSAVVAGPQSGRARIA